MKFKDILKETLYKEIHWQETQNTVFADFILSVSLINISFNRDLDNSLPLGGRWGEIIHQEKENSTALKNKPLIKTKKTQPIAKSKLKTETKWSHLHFLV